MFDGGLFKAARPISIISADSNSDIKCHYLGNSGPFHHAMWIPRSEQILVSMGDLDAFGITIEINGGLLRAFYGDRQIFEVRKANNVWMCNFDKLCSKIIANLPSRAENGVTLYGNQQLRPMALVSARSDSDEELFKLLHRRLCHRNMRDILRAVMTKRIYVGKGFASLITNVKSTIATYDSKCDACEKAKSHAQPHPSRNQPEASREPHTRLSQQDEVDLAMRTGSVVATVSTDMAGPYSVPSLIGAYRGNQTFIKRDSKKAYFYPYRKKSDAFDNLQHLVETRFRMERYNMKHYHSDGAGELYGSEIRKYLNDLGCKTTWTTLATPQQNSISERHFRTEGEGAQAMLLYARFLPTGLWTFAKEAFTHVYNLFPTTISKGWISPHEFETGKVPDLIKLKVWGCKCWANIPRNLRRKDLAPKSKVGYLMGYSQFQVDAYKIWIPSSNKIIMARDVVFDENIPQGDIDHAKDDYWRDVRLYTQVSKRGKAKFVEDYDHLVGCIFYDPEFHDLNIVTSIDVKKSNLVGTLARIVDGVQEDKDHDSMHVADIEKLLGIFDTDEDANGRACIAGHDHLDTRVRSDQGKLGSWS